LRAAFLLRPLCGVPLRIMLVLVGFRFGFIGGWVVAAFGLLIHNVAAYFITRGTFREPVRDFLKRSGYATPSIPAKHRIWFTAVIAAVPGPPYFTKLYLLALTDLPFRIYVGIGAPIYILLSFVPIGVGSAVTDFNMKWVYLLTAGVVLTTILGVWLKKHYSAEQMLKTGE
ncbi:MAG: hypothetical protein PF795_00815, partial [Kiritimatiellae bacterium]|nr:hypothetical protein [Kiritimatiellia bacterium]